MPSSKLRSFLSYDCPRRSIRLKERVKELLGTKKKKPAKPLSSNVFIEFIILTRLLIVEKSHVSMTARLERGSLRVLTFDGLGRESNSKFLP